MREMMDFKYGTAQYFKIVSENVPGFADFINPASR